MLKRNWALIALCYLAFAEVLSWAPVPDLSLCLIQPEHYEQAANHDNKKYCPAFHTGIVASFDAADGLLERHDKSLVAGFTVVLAISTIGLWLATNKLWVAGEKQFGLLSENAATQSRDMQESLEIARRAIVAEHRTWLKVYATEIGPIDFRDGKFRVSVGIEAINVGANPALSVSLACTIFRTGNRLPGQPEASQVIEQAKLFASVGLPGADLLPGEKTGVKFSADAAPCARVEVSEDFFGGFKPEGVYLTAVYGVIYRVIGSEDWKSASQILVIRRMDNEQFEFPSESFPVGTLTGTILHTDARFGH